MISNDICGDLNTLFGMASKKITPVKDIVAYKIRYIGDPQMSDIVGSHSPKSLTMRTGSLFLDTVLD